MIKVLIAKQGRSSQFSSQAERDTHLKKTLASLRKAVAAQQEQMRTLQQQEQDLNNALNEAATVCGVAKLIVFSMLCAVCFCLLQQMCSTLGFARLNCCTAVLTAHIALPGPMNNNSHAASAQLLCTGSFDVACTVK